MDNAEALHQKQKTEYGEQHAATNTLDKNQAGANKEYMRSVKLARVALEEKPQLLEKPGIFEAS